MLPRRSIDRVSRLIRCQRAPVGRRLGLLRRGGEKEAVESFDDLQADVKEVGPVRASISGVVSQHARECVRSLQKKCSLSR